MHERRQKSVQGFREKAQMKKTMKHQDIDGRMGSKQISGRTAGRKWIGFTWLKIESSGRLL
jgi:hypothetical protein